LDASPLEKRFSEGYFPRRFDERKHASAMVKDVAKRGGKAHLEKVAA
jgi:hypothetical protein